MTSWGAALLAGFLYLGLRRPKARSHTVLVAITMTLVVLLIVAVRQHTP
jgi:hypothetical protein